MFSVNHMTFGRLLPQIHLLEKLRQCFSMDQSGIDMDEMPESWKRDIGMLDGRDRRGPPDEGAFRATRMVYTQRSL